MVILRAIFPGISKTWGTLAALFGLLLLTSCTKDTVQPASGQRESLITVSSPQENNTPTQESLSFSTALPSVARAFIPYEYKPALASDVAVTWSLEDSPSEMTIDESTGHIRWTPGETDGGSETAVRIVATAVDDQSITGVQEGTISVESQWWDCDPSDTLPDFEFLSPSAGDTFYVGDTMHLQICLRNQDISLAQAGIAFSPDLGVTESVILHTHKSDEFFIDEHWIWVIPDTVSDVFLRFHSVSDQCIMKVSQYSVPQNFATSGVFSIVRPTSSVSTRRRTIMLE